MCCGEQSLGANKLCSSNSSYSNALKGIISAIPDVVGLSNATLPTEFTMPDPAASTNPGRTMRNIVPNGPLRLREPLSLVQRTDVPLVTIWTTQEWAEVLKEDSITDPNQVPKKKGKTNAYLGINTTMKYVQHQHGQVIDGYYASDIREGAYQIWYELLLRGLAPPKWSHISLSVADFYYQEMGYWFPELRFCGGSPANWKAKKVATDNYPTFIQGLLRKEMIHLLRPAPLSAVKRKNPSDNNQLSDSEHNSDIVLIDDLSPSSRGKRQVQKLKTPASARHITAK